VGTYPRGFVLCQVVFNNFIKNVDNNVKSCLSESAGDTTMNRTVNNWRGYHYRVIWIVQLNGSNKAYFQTVVEKIVHLRTRNECSM